MAEPSATPARAHTQSGGRGHRGIIPGGPATLTPACEAPAGRWHLHRQAAEIAPAADDHRLRSSQVRLRDSLLADRRSRALSTSTARGLSRGARLATRTRRRERHDPAARAPSLPTRASRPLRGRRSSRSLRHLGPLLTLLLAQVDQLVRWATPQTASRRRARRRQRRERREARGGASAVARGLAVGDAVAGRVCAVPVESGGDLRRDRCARARLHAMVCEPPARTSLCALRARIRSRRPRAGYPPAALEWPLWPVGMSCGVLLTLK